MNSEYKTVDHLFMMGDTIIAAIRACNNMQLSSQEIETLIGKFNILNPEAQPPSPGQMVKIPILPGKEGVPAR